MRRAIWIVIVAASHAAVAMLCITYAFAASMQRFDNPEITVGRSDRVASALAATLLLPGRILWTPWAAEHLPDPFEWIVFLANSLLWGWAIVTVVRVVTMRRRKGI